MINQLIETRHQLDLAVAQ